MSNISKHLIIILLTLFAFSAFAQPRKLKKIEKLYEKEKIEKCLKKSLKYKKKNPREFKIHEILSKIYLYEFNQNESITKKNTSLRKTIKHFDL